MGLNLLEHHLEELVLIEMPRGYPFIDPTKIDRSKHLAVKDQVDVLNDYVLWPDEEGEHLVDQIVVTPHAVLVADLMFMRGKAKFTAVPLSKEKLKSFQVSLLGSGLKLYAYGSTDDDSARKFDIRRSEEDPRPEIDDHPLLGLVNISTGEITDA